jgi:thiol-disulfide isomerase/thioredoxin
MEPISIQQYKGIPDLVKKQFKQKAVLIGIWATWCGPRKEEFRHSDSLSLFLNKNNIALLYLSHRLFTSRSKLDKKHQGIWP